MRSACVFSKSGKRIPRLPVKSKFEGKSIGKLAQKNFFKMGVDKIEQLCYNRVQLRMRRIGRRPRGLSARRMRTQMPESARLANARYACGFQVPFAWRYIPELRGSVKMRGAFGLVCRSYFLRFPQRRKGLRGFENFAFLAVFSTFALRHYFFAL